MKHSYLLSSLTLCLLLFAGRSQAQLSGTVTIPTTPKFPNLKAVVDSLNQYGVSGAVVIDVTADQTAPAGGYVLGMPGSALNAGNNATSATKTITINGHGHTVTAYTGTGTTDGIFIIAGVDYVTIDSLHLNDPNTVSGVEAMEWGYALLKHSNTLPYDGAQHITIRNCTISMTTLATNATAIYMGNHSPSGSTPLSGTMATIYDANRNNIFTGNKIIKCIRGIYMNGLTGNITLDNDNEVTGNTITFGGTSPAGIGIYTAFDSSVTVRGNIIGSAAGHTGTGSGIEVRDGKGNVHIGGNSISISSLGSSGTFYGIYITNARIGGANGKLVIDSNTIANWSLASVTSGAHYFIWNDRGTFDTTLIRNNTISNIHVGNDPSFSFGMANMYGIYNRVSGNASCLDVSDNTISNLTRTGALGKLTLLYNSTTDAHTGILTVAHNSIVRVTNTTDIDGIHINPGENRTSVIQYNKLDSITISGSGSFSGYYQSGSPVADSMEVAYDTLTNITTGTGSINGYQVSFPGITSLHHCFFNNLRTASGRISCYNYNGGSTASVYKNIFSNISASETSSGLYGIISTGFALNLSIYNNVISNIGASNTFSAASGIYGMSLGAGQYSVYHNTIRINPSTTTGADLGATGIYYDGNATLDLRNNIIYVDVTPKGAGFTAALRRSTGTAGVAPSNLSANTNGNIYYAPLATNSYLYAEGASIPLANAFQASPAAVNIACGTYKAFMAPRDSRSFVENNLVAGTVPATWLPTGSSYAEGIGVPTFDPVVMDDIAGNLRPAQPDAGALEFSGASMNAAGPVIAYTPLPAADYCTNTGPVLAAVITGAVNTTSGAAPRLYYRKASEDNAFGVYPANNNNSFNGWKYVEATGTAPNFSFAIDYGKLGSPVAAGDSIVYFVIAQDNAATPNVTVNAAGFATGFCVASVNLTAAAGPVSASPELYGYKILPATFATVSLNGNVCVGATTTLALTPPPAGATYQWQRDDNTGAFTDIQGATGSTYTTAALDTSDNYRARITLCGSTVTSVPVHVNVTIPQVVDTADARRCGSGSLTLGATGSPGTVLKWYNVPAGGVPLDTGATFTTPVLSATTDYYVSALNGNGGETIPSPAGTIRTPYGSWGTYSSYGQFFSVNTEATINSVKIYLSAYTPSKAYVSVWIYDQINTGAAPIIGPLDSFMADTTMRSYIIPVNVTLPVGRYKMTLSTSLGNFSSLYTTTGSYPYYSLSGAVAVTGGGDVNPNLADYYFLYDWSVNAGCESPRRRITATIDTVTAVITPPAGPTTFCADDSLTLFAGSNIGYAYQWLRDNAVISGATASFYDVHASGDYRVYVVNGSCSDTSSGVSVTVNPLPVPVITASGANDELLETGSYASYQWYRDGLELNGATGRTYTATQGGDYEVRVRDANGCEGVSAPKHVPLGVADAGYGRAVSIHPNPADDVLYITSPAPVNIMIHAADGKVVWQQQATRLADIRTLAPGIYMIRITDNSGRLLHMEKLVKRGL